MMMPTATYITKNNQLLPPDGFVSSCGTTGNSSTDSGSGSGCTVIIGISSGSVVGAGEGTSS
jgi:hypothetical protein